MLLRINIDRVTEEMGNANTVVIDEISMMGALKFYKVDQILRKVGDEGKPFGGYNMILLGDFLQLRPVKQVYCFIRPSY